MNFTDVSELIQIVIRLNRIVVFEVRFVTDLSDVKKRNPPTCFTKFTAYFIVDK